MSEICRSQQLQNKSKNEIAKRSAIAEQSSPRDEKHLQIGYVIEPASRKPDDRNVSTTLTNEPIEAIRKLTAPVATFLKVPKELLQDIFGQLDLSDLASVARVCTYFQETADKMYLKKYGDSLSLDLDSKMIDKEALFQLIENVVTSFGPIVNQLKISSIDARKEENRHDDAILRVVDKYFACDENDDSRKTLTLERFHFQQSSIPICQSVFDRIHKLELIEIKVYEGAKAAFANCSNLTDLTINRSQTNPLVQLTLGSIIYGKIWSRWVADDKPRDACLDHHFPQLKTILLDHVGTLQCADIKEFVRKNPQLLTLNIVKCYSLSVSAVHSALHELNVKSLRLGFSTKSGKFVEQI